MLLLLDAEVFVVVVVLKLLCNVQEYEYTPNFCNLASVEECVVLLIKNLKLSILNNVLLVGTFAATSDDSAINLNVYLKRAFRAFDGDKLMFASIML